jgi:hypothetical protein
VPQADIESISYSAAISRLSRQVAGLSEDEAEALLLAELDAPSQMSV